MNQRLIHSVAVQHLRDAIALIESAASDFEDLGRYEYASLAPYRDPKGIMYYGPAVLSGRALKALASTLQSGIDRETEVAKHGWVFDRT